MIFVTGPSPPLLGVSWSFTSDTPPKLRKMPGLHTANWGKSKCFLLQGPSVASFLSLSDHFSDFRTARASRSGEHPGESDRIGTGFGRLSTTNSPTPGPKSRCNAPPTSPGPHRAAFCAKRPIGRRPPVANRRDPRPAPRFAMRHLAVRAARKDLPRGSAGAEILTAACCGCDRT